MIVLLLNSPFEFEDSRVQAARAGARWAHRESQGFVPFPFFLAYAASVVRDRGHRVGVIDAVAEKLNKSEFLRRVEAYNPDIVFMECSTPSIATDLKFAELIKETTDAITVLGGPHVSVLGEDVLKANGFIDYILKNEYDFTLAELASAIERRIDLGSIKGLCRRNSNKIFSPREMPYVENLDNLPLPARDLFPMSLYNEGLCERPNVSIMTSRGCPYNCTFCLWPQTFYGTRRYRFRTTSLVVDEIEMLLNRYKPREIYFDDDTFTVNRERVMDISDAIKRRNLKFKWDCLGHVANIDREMLLAMKEAGCNRIRYGVETASDSILKNINKGITSSQIKEVFFMTKDAGISRHATVTFGLPGETKQTMRDTIRFILEIDPETVQFSMAAPFPGTKFFKTAEEKGWLRKKEWSMFDGHSYSVLDMENVSAADIEAAFREANGTWAVHRRRRGDNTWQRNTIEFIKHPFRALKFLRCYLRYKR